MLEFIYWLGSLYKTLAILSLIIYLPENKYQTQISKGFLWLYLNEVVLFFVSFYVDYLFSSRQYALIEVCKLVTNIYFVLIYSLLMAWLMIWKKTILSKYVQVLTIVFIIFSWMALMIVGIFSVVIISINQSSQDDSNIQNFSSLASGLAWLLCIIKLLIQYNHNKIQSIGLNYLFLIFTICWATCEAIYEVCQEQNDILRSVTISVFAVIVAWVCLALYAQRRQNLRLMEQASQEQRPPEISYNNTIPQNITNESLRDSLIDKLKQSDRTNYTSSFVESVDNN